MVTMDTYWDKLLTISSQRLLPRLPHYLTMAEPQNVGPPTPIAPPTPYKSNSLCVSSDNSFDSDALKPLQLLPPSAFTKVKK